MSRLKASAPGGRKNGSFFPHTARSGGPMRVLPLRRCGSEEFAQGVAVLFRGILPIRPDGIPPVTQPFLVRIAVLRDEGRDPVRVSSREAKPRRRPVIEEVERVSVKADDRG